MIVTDKMAREAADLLGVHFETISEAAVNMAYRGAAKRAHPDMGGTAEQFAAVDRAKHILLQWLTRGVAPAIADTGTACPKCSGKGFLSSQRGWRAMRVQCPRCRGAGDLETEHEGPGADGF